MIKMKQLKNELANNGNLTLPIFEKTENGWEQSVDRVKITTLAELKAYFEVYKEIRNYINQNFTSTIKQIYTNSLGAMIDPEHGFEKFIRRFDNGPRTIDQRRDGIVQDERIDVSLDENLKTILWAINSNTLSKQYKPSKEVIDLLNSKSTNIDYIIPRITPNGTIDVKPTKNKLSMLTIGLNEEEGQQLMQELLNDNFFADKEELVVNFFDCAKKLATANKNSNLDSMNFAFYNLLDTSSKLFDIDLGKILKGAPRGPRIGSIDAQETNEFQNDDGSIVPDQNETKEFIMPTSNRITVIVPTNRIPNDVEMSANNNALIFVFKDGQIISNELGETTVTINNADNAGHAGDNPLEISK